MRFYMVSEVMEINGVGSYTTNNNQVKEKMEALDFFISRRKMLIETKDVKVLKDMYLESKSYGVVKVELSDGNTIELTMSKLVLV